MDECRKPTHAEAVWLADAGAWEAGKLEHVVRLARSTTPSQRLAMLMDLIDATDPQILRQTRQAKLRLQPLHW